MARIFARSAAPIHGPPAEDRTRLFDSRSNGGSAASLAAMDEQLPLRKPIPGRLFTAVKVGSYLELALFCALLFFWIAPGYEGETAVFGLAHGLGFVALCGLIWFACLRREAPWPLFAATLTPVGPLGSVIGIGLIERRGWGVAGHES